MSSEDIRANRLLPTHEPARRIARELYDSVRKLPIVSPHGHVDPQWLAEDEPFTDAASLLLTPDHYLLRLLHSHGVPLVKLGVARRDGTPGVPPRQAWRTFAEHRHLFDATPSGLWFDESLGWAFGIEQRLEPRNADLLFDRIGEALATPALRPRAVLKRANVETIATTESALDPLVHHERLRDEGLIGAIRTTYRPDDVTDPDNSDFVANVARLGELTGEETATWSGLMDAHRVRRARFREFGAVATDHGVPDARTADLALDECQALLDRVLKGRPRPDDASLFRAQMLTEMAGLSVEDGMVMQIHAGAARNTDPALHHAYGPNMGADVPARGEFVKALGPLLARYGNAPGFRLILFTLDESTYARELAPLAGYWRAVTLGPPWWFHDSPEGMRRYFAAVVETAGLENLAGFNDDTRALLSIPVRHDVWRREVARFLATLVVEGRLSDESAELAAARLANQAARDAYGLADSSTAIRRERP